jgi:ATP-dependent RNA helicase DDX23/PRP28
MSFLFQPEIMTTIKFIPRAERERLQREEEKRKVEERKQIEQENKAKKKEFLKKTFDQSLTDHPMTTAESGLTGKEQEMIKSRYLGAPSSNVQSKQKQNPASAKFDWDYELEDTAEPNQEEEAVIPQRNHSSSDPLEKLDRNTSLIHWSQKLSKEMTERDWRIFREDHKIYISGGRVPNPFRSWSESTLPRELLESIHKAGYTKPSPIQMQSIPIAMQQRDLVGISSTGSGKTAAFVLPMLYYIKQLPPITAELAGDGPYGLVLAPSRELALQIEQEAVKFSSFCRIRICSIVGGRSAEQQTLTLSQGVELIVATPGRLADSLDAKQTVLNQCFYVVLDEADRMVDLGFEPFLNSILDAIPSGPRRITQMFSATMPVSVEKLTRKYLVQPVTVTVGDVSGGEAKSQIQQRIEFVQSEAEKRNHLLEAIESTESPIIVFVNSKRNADYVGTLLDNTGYRVMVLHSGKIQQRREEALNQFKEGSADVLVATDVAGRGIDVQDVQHVINYDMARTIDDYTHRIGRTGRAGKSGLATSFILPIDEEILPSLKKFLIDARQIIPPEMDRIVVPTNLIDGEGMGTKRKRDGTVYAI